MLQRLLPLAVLASTSCTPGAGRPDTRPDTRTGSPVAAVAPEGPLSEGRVLHDDLNLWYGLVAFTRVWATQRYHDLPIADLDLRVTYGFGDDPAFTATLGPGFRHGLEAQLRREGDAFRLITAWSVVTYRRDPGRDGPEGSGADGEAWHARDQGVFDTLRVAEDGSVRIRDGAQVEAVFRPAAKNSALYLPDSQSSPAGGAALATRFEWTTDTAPVLTRVTGPYGRAFGFSYTGAGAARRLTAVTGPDGLRITFSYDAEGRLTEIRRGERSERYQWVRAFGHDFLRGLDDGDSNFKQWRYCGVDTGSPPCPVGMVFGEDLPFESIRLARTPRAGDAQNPDPASQGLRVVITTNGREIQTLGFNALGLRDTTSDERGTSVTVWDTGMRLAASENLSDGLRVRMQHDQRGNLVERVGEAPGFLNVQRWVYDPHFDRPIKIESDGQVALERRYDPRRGLLMSERRGQNLSRFEYDGEGRLVARAESKNGETDPDELYRVMEIDRRGNVTGVIREGELLRYSHDDAGRVVALNRPEGASWFDFPPEFDRPTLTRHYRLNRMLGRQAAFYFSDGTLALRVDANALTLGVDGEDGEPLGIPLDASMREAFQTFDGFVPEEAVGVLSLAARTYRRAGHPRQALATARLAARHAPDLAEAHRLVATLASLGAEAGPNAFTHDLRLEALTRAAALDRADFRSQFDAGAQLLASQRSKEAHGFLIRARALNPDSAQTAFLVALAAATPDKQALAATAKSYAQRMPDSESARQAAVCLLLREGLDDAARGLDPTGSITSCDSDLPLFIWSEDGEGDRGDAALAEDDTKAALTHYRESMRRFPRWSVTHLRLARAFIAAGHDEGAESMLLTAVKLNPADAVAAVELARFHGRTGAPEARWPVLVEAIKHVADRRAVFIEMARLAREGQDLAEATRWMKLWYDEARAAYLQSPGHARRHAYLEAASQHAAAEARALRFEPCATVGLETIAALGIQGSPAMQADLRATAGLCLATLPTLPQRIDEARALLEPIQKRTQGELAVLYARARVEAAAGNRPAARQALVDCLTAQPNQPDCAALLRDVGTDTEL